MKDKIFIIWSGNKDLAVKVKKLLSRYDYTCYVGGGDEQSDNRNMTVGDTIRTQMNECNQAIVLFNLKKTDDVSQVPAVSQNLFFELGYTFSTYGKQKVHCVRKKGEDIVLPSDFDNSFVEMLEAPDEDTYAQNIVEYFLKRQKMTLTRNKLDIINNRYTIREIIKQHYNSQIGSKCSDYELAQYILFYTQAAHMYRDEQNILNELKDFKQKYYTRTSKELSLSIDLGIAYLEMVNKLQKEEDGDVFIDYDTFGDFCDVCESIIAKSENDPVGDYYLWLELFTYEFWNYAYLLLASNNSEEEDDRREYMINSVKMSKEAFDRIEKIISSGYEADIRDKDGLIALMQSYMYRNQFLIMRDLDEEGKKYLADNNYIENTDLLYWLEKAFETRKEMVTNFKGCIDSAIYDHISMEYYLIACEYMKYAPDVLPKDQKRRIDRGVETFVKSQKQKKEENFVYVTQIEQMYNSLHKKQ